MGIDKNSKEFQDKVKQIKKIKYIALGICVLLVIAAVIVQR